MRFTIQLVIDDGDCSEKIEEIIQFDKDISNKNTIGISLNESKQLMKMVHC